MVKCLDCGKEILEDEGVYCDMYGAPLCKERGATGLCSNRTELWTAEIDMEDMETEEA